jgi:phage gpG-like protein
MISVGISIAGDAAALARLTELPGALRTALAAQFAAIADALYARVMEKLDGGVVRSATGRLKSAITEESDGLSATIGVDPDIAPYGAALEFGASIPAQLIAVKNARALVFIVGSQQVFAKRVMRPAFALPAHSFLRSALAEMAPDILAQLDSAVSEAISP